MVKAYAGRNGRRPRKRILAKQIKIGTSGQESPVCTSHSKSELTLRWRSTLLRLVDEAVVEMEKDAATERNSAEPPSKARSPQPTQECSSG